MQTVMQAWPASTASITKFRVHYEVASEYVDLLIEARVDVLTEFPQRGRIGRIAGTRELVIGHAPYIAAYRIIDDTVIILRLLHGARQWPDDLLD